MRQVDKTHSRSRATREYMNYASFAEPGPSREGVAPLMRAHNDYATRIILCMCCRCIIILVMHTHPKRSTVHVHIYVSNFAVHVTTYIIQFPH